MEEFLKELTELSRKSRIVIGGCGCCGSPWLWKDKPIDFEKHEYTVSPDEDYLTFGEISDG